jgi:hypothetical protein
MDLRKGQVDGDGVTTRLYRRFLFFKLYRDVAVDDEATVSINAEVPQDLTTEFFFADQLEVRILCFDSCCLLRNEVLKCRDLVLSPSNSTTTVLPSLWRLRIVGQAVSRAWR